MRAVDRRRGMGAHKKEPLPYNSDGLIFYLDGINKGASDGSWIDLIGGLVFTNYNATVNADSFELSDNAYLNCMTGLTGNNQYTVEIVIQTDIYKGMAFQSQEYNECVQIYFNNTNKVQYCKSNGYNFDNTQPISILSLNNDVGLQNGVELNKNTGIGSYSHGNQFAIGRNNYSGGRHYFSGKIYAIRIYNRILSKSELLNNQRVDNLRFNLGLTIPT